MAVADGSAWSFYQLLQARPDASTDEIKTAFKRRALEVHPDKGGSKEAFHQVYQAFLTLVDPKSRQAYDEQRTKKQARTGAAYMQATSMQAKPAKCKQTAGVKHPSPYPTRLMMKIHHLLQQVPRDVRLEVISKDFSQQQRVLLQKWMMDGKEQEVAQGVSQQAPPASSNRGVGRLKRLAMGESNPREIPPKRTKKSYSTEKGIYKLPNAECYWASVCINGYLEMKSRGSNLPTALENLVILTSAKQKMQECKKCQYTFEERLEQVLKCSAIEHGKLLENVKVRFRARLFAGDFIGKQGISSPFIHSFEALGRLHACMESYRAGRIRMRGRDNIFKYASPCELRDWWQRFQETVVKMFQVAGSDGRRSLCKARTWYDACEPMRQHGLRQWEKPHMSAEDTRVRQWKTKHVPKAVLREWRKRSKDQELKMLVARWKKFLELQSADLEKQRRKILQQRRTERTALRRAQRRAFTQRMKDPHLTMEDLLGPSRQHV